MQVATGAPGAQRQGWWCPAGLTTLNCMIRPQISAVPSVLLALCVVVLGIPAFCAAQSLPFPKGAVAATPTQAQPDPDLASPRQTLKTFLAAMEGVKNGQRSYLDDAAKCLDFGDLPEAAQFAQVRELPYKLYAILKHERRLVPERVSAKDEGPPVVLKDDEAGIVVIEKSGPNWLFSRRTVAALSETYRHVEASLSPRALAASEADEIASPTMWIRRRVPVELKSPTLWLEGWQWVGMLGIFILGLVLKGTVRKVLPWILGRAAKHLPTFPDPMNTIRFVKAASYLVLGAFLLVGLGFLDLPLGFYSRLSILLALIQALALASMLYFAAGPLTEGVFRSGLVGPRDNSNALVAPFFRRVIRLVTIVFGIFLVLGALGLNAPGLVAGLGLGGLIVAFAAKDTFENMFGSVAILLDQPFRVGDWISVTGGPEGTVEEIGLRSTRIRTGLNSLVTVPNTKLITAPVDNLGAREWWCIRLTLRLSTHTTRAQIVALLAGLRELCALHPRVKQDSIWVGLQECTPVAIEIQTMLSLRRDPQASELRDRENLLLAMWSVMEDLEVRFVAAPEPIPAVIPERQGEGDTARELPLASDGDLRQRAMESARRAVIALG